MNTIDENLTNEQILNTFANKMLSAVEGIEAFGKEQIPDYIEQVLLYNFWSNGLWIAFSLLIIITMCIAAFALFKYTSKIEDTTDKWCTRGTIGVCIIIVLGVFATNIAELVEENMKIKIAPKVYIVDYIRIQLKPNRTCF